MNDLDGSKSRNKKEIISQGNVDKYELVSAIFSDNDFNFYDAIDKTTNQKFLVKKLKQSPDNLSKLKHFTKEAEFLSKFNSPFIIKYIDFNSTKSTLITEYTSNRTLQNLFDQKISNKDGFDDTNKIMLIYGIASGMAHVHSKGIIHGDLNPESIFLDDYLLPKISNFYRSHLPSNKKDEYYDIFLQEKINQILAIGSLFFIAPELIEGDEYDQSIDVFSFAIIVYMIVAGKKPPLNLIKICQGEPIEFDKNFPESYKNLIMSCMLRDPKQRPTFQEIVSALRTDQSFLTSNIDRKKFLDFVDSKKTKFNFKKFHIDFFLTKELLVEIDPIDLSLFKKMQYVGQGQFGEVYKVKDKKTSKIYSAKINKKNLDEISEAELINITQEINTLSKFDSPLILKFVGYNQRDFENEQYPTIITNFCLNDSLDKIIEMQKIGLTPLEWNDTKVLINAYGIAAGMAYIHSMNILHRDLKPGNVFLDEYLFPKIGDFGLSMKLSNESSNETYSIIGTPAFISPEIYVNSKYSKASDVYAYGILLYQLITLQTPFKGYSFYKILTDVPKGIRPLFNFEIPKCYKNLIERCWDNNPDNRPSFEEIVYLFENDSEFITESIDTDDYYNYIDYIKDTQANKSFQQVAIDFDEIKRIQNKDKQLNISYIDLNNFQKLDLVRKIDFFNIYKIKSKEKDEFYEAKVSIYSITNLSHKNLIHLSREINILSKFKHPSFLKFIGFSPVDFNNQCMPVIITEMPPNRSLKDLLDMERNYEKIEEWDSTKKLINIYGIASGMSFLHSCDVIHRNLSPESIFLDEHLFTKIGNFGLLIETHSEESMTFQTTIGIKGNHLYSSPEILEKNVYSKSSDVYAFGFIVYEIMTQKIPFKKIRDLNNLFNEVVNKKNRPKINSKVSEKYRQLIEMCWTQNPDERPSFDHICSILKNDLDFITEDVNKEIFQEYVRFIDESDVSFYSEKQVVKFDDIINEKKLTEHNNNLNQEILDKEANEEELQYQKMDAGFIQKTEKMLKKNEEELQNQKIGDGLIYKTEKLLKENESTQNSIEELQSNKKMNHQQKKNHQYNVLNNYILQNQIGSSSFGRVYKAKHKMTGEIFAASISLNSLQDNSDNLIKEISQEFNIITQLDHPLILKFIFFSPENFKGKQKPVIITEFAKNGSLDKLLGNEHKSILNDTKKLIIIYGIAEAMSYLHSNEIIHQDLNPSNVFLDDLLLPKISCFGLSKVSQLINNNGTPIYMAPEIWEKSLYSKSTDVSAFSLIVYEIITNEKPFKEINFFELPDKIKNGYRPKFKKPVPLSYQKLIESCWSPNPQDRPTFDQVLIQLSNDSGFITDSVDKNEYTKFLKYIKQCKISFDSTKNYLNFNHLNKISSSEHKPFIVSKLTSKFYTYKKYILLDENCKQIIDTADNNCEKLFGIAKSLIEGYDNFPHDLQIGLQYLKESIKQNHIKSIIYYCNLLIKGKFIPQNLKKAKKLIDNRMTNNKSMYLYLLGKIHLKEKQYDEAKIDFKKSFQMGNDESMYEYGKMIYKGQGFLIDKNQSVKFFESSIESGNARAMFKYGRMIINKEVNGRTKEEGINYIKQSANDGYLKAMHYYSLMLLKGENIPSNKELAISLLKKSADKGYIESMYQYGLYLQNENKFNQEYIKYFKKAADKGNIESIYKYGMIFYEGNVVPIDRETASKYLKIAAKNGNSDAMAYYGKILLSGECILVDKQEALEYIRKGISKDNKFALYFFASMLKNGIGVPQNIEEAVKYYKMAIDKGNSDAMADYSDILKKEIEVPKKI